MQTKSMTQNQLMTKHSSTPPLKKSENLNTTLISQRDLTYSKQHKDQLYSNLLLIPSEKLSEYISSDILNINTNETNTLVDQMASFIEELKDFIDDRLIDTTSQLEMTNRHIYHLYKGLKYLIKEFSSLKIKNEELKQELLIIQSYVQSKSTSNHEQKTLKHHPKNVSCNISLKNDLSSKSNENFVVENSTSEENEYDRIFESKKGLIFKLNTLKMLEALVIGQERR